MRKPIIRLENVWKIYSLGEAKVNALQGLDLEIFPGEFVAVQGPSGSGKSTAVNMIGSLDYPSRGKVYLNGRDITSFSESDLAQLRGQTIGFVFQSFNLLPTLSAIDNVALPMMFQGVSRQKQLSTAREILVRVGLGHRLDNRPGQLSGGEQQRVAIARAMANNPEMILADEPTGNLDSSTGKAIIELLKEVNKEKKTIVMVTHDVKLSREADRTIYLKDGKAVKRL